MKKGDTVYTEEQGKGIILEVSEVLRVDFEDEGFKIIQLDDVLEIEETIEEPIKETSYSTVNDIYSSIVGTRETRHSNWQMIVKPSVIMQLADEKGSFVSQIVEDAINGKRVTEKQAWAVAYFAKENGLSN